MKGSENVFAIQRRRPDRLLSSPMDPLFVHPFVHLARHSPGSMDRMDSCAALNWTTSIEPYSADWPARPFTAAARVRIPLGVLLA
jgi:hypothetical protein